MIVLLAINLSKPERSVASFCKEYKQQLDQLPASKGDGYKVEVFPGKSTGDAKVFKNAFNALESVAPKDIKPDVITLRKVFESIVEDPANAVNASLMKNMRPLTPMILSCVYWKSSLTRLIGCLQHCWKGENRTKQVLSGALKPETLELLDQIKPTEWGEMKTDAIDFSQRFLWLDDDLWPEELAALEKHNATDNFIMIDLNKNPNQLKDILEII